ncbi:MAG: PQQ-binding-like beta-propeller repeat protein [Planctomycetota bacterium]|jgi:outer membrane protein assembly factor BamB
MKKHITKGFFLTTLCLMMCGASSLALADDWPRFLGPNADSISSETGINKDWSSKPPKELWRISLTDEGYSGPAVKGDVLYILDHKETNDLVRAVDVTTGEDIWNITYPEVGRENHGYTRCTPTIDNDRVYTVSRSGVVHCLNISDGSKVWYVDVMNDHEGKPPRWGASNSAYIDGEQLIAIGAGENSHVVALDKHTGKKLWAGGGSDIAGYATPIKAQIDGKKQYLVFTGTSFIGVESTSGNLLWRHPWETRLDSNASSPIQVDSNLIWIASGYRRGCALLRIKDNTVEEVWSDTTITPHWSSAVFMDGFIYTTTPPGYLVCVNAKTGEEQWRSKGNEKGFEHGGLCAVDGTLIVIEGNTGNVVQVALSSQEYKELGRINPLESTNCWVAPIVANKKLYVRSPSELVCLDISN